MPGWEGDFDFSTLRENLARVTPDALKAGGEVIGRISDDKTPVLVDLKRANKVRRTQVGKLKDSRYVRVTGNAVAVGYSWFVARFQHERIDYKHEIGESKFLERAFVEGKDEALQAIADKIQGKL